MYYHLEVHRRSSPFGVEQKPVYATNYGRDDVETEIRRFDNRLDLNLFSNKQIPALGRAGALDQSKIGLLRIVRTSQAAGIMPDNEELQNFFLKAEIVREFRNGRWDRPWTSAEPAVRSMQRHNADGQAVASVAPTGQDRVTSERVTAVTSPTQRTNTARIFISHASHDRKLADALVQLLQLGTDLTRQQVFYTSGTGTGVPTGQNFVDYIRDQLRDTELVILLITPAFLASHFCMCELGAVWVLQPNLFPIIVPPVTHDNIRGILANVQVESLAHDVGGTLDSLHDRVKEALQLNPHTATWNANRQRFIDQLPSLLLSLEQKST